MHLAEEIEAKYPWKQNNLLVKREKEGGDLVFTEQQRSKRRPRREAVMTGGTAAITTARYSWSDKNDSGATVKPGASVEAITAVMAGCGHKAG